MQNANNQIAAVKTTEQENYTAAPAPVKMTIGKTTYIVNVFFNQNAKETVGDKIKRMIENDVKYGNV